MTAKQILDSFSETLMRDERILSPQERELLMSLLQNSRAVSSIDPQTQSAVTAAIARAVGETVAQRAFALLGSSIVEQILARSGMPAGTEETMLAATVRAGAPQPPNPAPAPGRRRRNRRTPLRRPVLRRRNRRILRRRLDPRRRNRRTQPRGRRHRNLRTHCTRNTIRGL